MMEEVGQILRKVETGGQKNLKFAGKFTVECGASVRTSIWPLRLCTPSC